jgi:hypothetical protein
MRTDYSMHSGPQCSTPRTRRVQATVHLRSYRPLPCPMTAVRPSPNVHTRPSWKDFPLGVGVGRDKCAVLLCTLHTYTHPPVLYCSTWVGGRKEEKAGTLPECAARLAAFIASLLRHHRRTCVLCVLVHGFAIGGSLNPFLQPVVG